MKNTSRRIATALGALLATTLVAAPAARAQTTAELEKGLADYVKKKNDGQAVAVIDQLAKSFSKMTDDEKKVAIAAIEHTLNAPREDTEDKLYEAAVVAFSEMGEAGEKATLRALKAANVEKRRSALASAIRSLASHKDLAQIPTIQGYLVHSESVVVAAAAEGLGNYSDQPEKGRKPIVEELVKNYATFGSAAANNKQAPKDLARAKARLNDVERAFQSSLEKMTGQKFDKFELWQKWWNEHKDKKWDPAAKG